MPLSSYKKDTKWQQIRGDNITAAIRSIIWAEGPSIGFTEADISVRSFCAGGGHVSPHGAGGPRHHPPIGEVAEWHNNPLPPKDGKGFHQEPRGQDFRTWCPHAHSAGSRQQLVPSGAQGPSRTLLQRVSGGLAQDQCGLDNINIFFLAHSSLEALVDRSPSRLSVIVVVNHFHLRVPYRQSVLSPEARTRALEATFDQAAYLVGDFRPILFRR